MLVLGTQILDWRVPMFLSIAAFVTAAIRIRRRIVGRYEVAQILDEQLRLSDSLSTAWFLLTAGEGCGAIARVQIERAERLAGSFNARSAASAFPIERERSWVAAIGLAVVFLALFAIRYGVNGGLTFERSLIPLHLGFITERTEEANSSTGQANRELKRWKAVKDRDNASQDSPLGERILRSSPNTLSASAPAHESADAQSNANGENAEAGTASEAKPSGAHSRDSRTVPNTTNQMLNQTSGEPRQSASLLDRMEDALSGLLSKIRSAQPQKSTENGDPSRSAATESEHSGRRGQSTSHSAPRGDERASSVPDAAEHGQTAEKPQPSQGRNSGGSSDQSGSNARSGIGNQNGEKNLNESDQIQAMGKLAEIIGKRSASVTGEVTIETPAGKQQLKTAYSKQMGRHADLGGEINRDEVPLIYRQYVRDYMEEVHKQAK